MVQQMSMFGDEVPANKEYILLTIQLQYWQRVLDGIKHYEYRRVFRHEAVNAFIYAPMPVGKMLGYVEFDVPIHDTLEEICRIAESEAPGSTPGMMEYMAGLTKAYAVPILKHEEIEPITLKQVRERFPDFSPPQSYSILDKHPDLLAFFQSLRKKD